MNKPWMGYLGSVMIIIAGIIIFFDKTSSNSYLLGSLLLLAGVGGLILKMYLGRRSKR